MISVCGPSRRWVGVVLVAALAAGCSSDPDDIDVDPVDRLPKTEYWAEGYGWRELPAAPVGEPRERWRVPVRFDDNGDYSADEGVLVTFEDSGGTPTARRISVADGSTQWSAPLPGMPLTAEVGISPDHTLIGVHAGQGPSEVAVLDAADGRLIWRGAGDSSRVSTLGDLVLVRLKAGTLAIERATGRTRWQSPRSLLSVIGGALIDDPAEGPYAVLDPATAEPRWTLPRPSFSDAHVLGDTFMLTYDLHGDTDAAVAYDLATGTERWRVSVPSLGRAHSHGLDGTHILLTSGGGLDENAFSVLELASGKRVWGGSGDATALRVDGKPYVLADKGANVTVHEAATGRTAGKAKVPALSASMAGGACYEFRGNEVVALALPKLTAQWRVAVVGESGALTDVVPNGFLTSDVADNVGHVVAYLG